MTDRHWPGVQAILPIAGTAAVIAARQTDSRITGNPIAHWIGVNSYSIYLWHWPVALLVMREAPGNPIWSAVGVAASFALGHLSYRFVERAVLRKRGDGARPTPQSRMVLAGGLVAALAAIALLGRLVSASDGWVSRYPPAVAQVARDAFAAPDYPEGCFSVLGDVPRRCVIGRGSPALTLVGDSHAASAFGGVARAMAAVPGRSMVFNAYASCPPLLGVSSLDPQSRCGAFNAAHVAPLARPRTEPVLLVADWQSYLDKPVVTFGGESSARRFASEVRHTACALARGGPTFIALPVPGFPWRVPFRLQSSLISGGQPAADRLGIGVAEYHRSQGWAIAVLREAARQCGVGIVDPAQWLCRDGFCRASMGGRPFYYDRHHLTVFGSRETSPVYAPVVDAARAVPAGAMPGRTVR